MKDFKFPIISTKVRKRGPANFDLEDPAGRRKYFNYKVGSEIKKIQNFLKKNTFVAFLLGPKNSGKGTYSKLFAEAVGLEHIGHISIGDIVRNVHEDFSNAKRKKELLAYLKNSYRGFVPLNKAIDALLGRDTSTLLPTELILSLVEREISRSPRKALFIDGFPRNLDQVTYSLYFRALIGYRDDPDFFVFIDVPESVIDERLKYRVICPKCHTPRNTKLLKTKSVGYDKVKKEFSLKCDDPKCKEARMIAKEGDDLGIEAIRSRIEVDEEVMSTLLKLEGVPQVYLRNALPARQAKRYVDGYELTPAYYYKLDDKGKVVVTEKPWVIKNDSGIDSYSLMPAPVVVSLIKQVVKVLGL